MNTTSTLVDTFRRFLTARAKKEGVDISALQIAGVTLDRTWGDLAGYVFYGCADDVNERIARCFEAYAHKHATTGSYESQRSIGFRGPRYRHEYVNGAKSWSASDEGSKFTGLACPIQKGFAVSTTYYPCAD